jgi:hypothetical protein
MKSQSTQTKPSIVFCHGLWADGSCFSKLIVPLQAEGYECIAAQYGLTKLEVRAGNICDQCGDHLLACPFVWREGLHVQLRWRGDIFPRSPGSRPRKRSPALRSFQKRGSDQM